MACIGGILLFVAFNMVKPAEVKQVLATTASTSALMVYTAIAVIVTDFLTGVLTAIILYALLFRFLDRPEAGPKSRSSRAGPMPLPPRRGRRRRRSRPPARHDRTPGRAAPAGGEVGDMHRNRNLMIGLSRTDTDPGLIRYAAMVARLGTAEKAAFVHVAPARHDPRPGPDREGLLDELRAEVREHFTDVPESVRVRCEVLEGPLLDRLLATAAASRADVLLIGHRRDHPGKRALARRLAMKAPCSVWMVPEGSPAGGPPHPRPGRFLRARRRHPPGGDLARPPGRPRGVPGPARLLQRRDPRLRGLRPRHPQRGGPGLPPFPRPDRLPRGPRPPAVRGGGEHLPGSSTGSPSSTPWTWSSCPPAAAADPARSSWAA